MTSLTLAGYGTLMLKTMLAALLLTSGCSAGRQKRFVYFNHDTDMTVGLLVGVPISVTLPSLLPGKSWARSLGDRGLPEGRALESDPHHEEQEEKLQLYFSYLQIPEGPCQERILCDLAASPDEYFPASEIMLKELDPGSSTGSLDPASRLAALLRASKVGFNEGRMQCKKIYAECPVGADDVLSRVGLKIWQWLGTKLQLSFKN